MPELRDVSDIDRILSKHDRWRGRCLNVIASENVPSPTIRRYLTCDFGGRYPTYQDDPVSLIFARSGERWPARRWFWGW